MATGWYQLPSGQPYFGTVPPGVEQIEAPTPIDAEGTTVLKPEVGWYRLARSEAAFFGTIPEGAEVLDGPPLTMSGSFASETGQELVDVGEGGDTVTADDAGVDLTTEAEQLPPLPAGATIRGDDVFDDDGDFLGHVDEFAPQEPEA